jgi:hypothetical protein
MGIVMLPEKVVCEHWLKGEVLRGVKQAIYPGADNASRIRKLRQMTVKRGCTPAEEASAHTMIRKLERRS